MAEEIKSLQDAHPVNDTPKDHGEAPKKETLAERNMRAALERKKEIEEAKKAEEEALLAERRNDGRKYTMEVEGFNIGDSLVRRQQFMDKKVAEGQQELLDEEMAEDVDGIDNQVNDTSSESDLVDNTTDDAAVDADDDDFELDDDYGSDDSMEIEKVDSAKEATVVEEEKKADNVVPMPEPIQKESTILDKASSATQDSFEIDDEDFDDIDLDDEVSDDASTDSDDTLTEEEMEELKKQLSAKIMPSSVEPDDIVISDKPVSVNQLLSLDQTKDKAADWPAFHSGKLITMKSFSGEELESLNKQIPARNRFNTMKDMYRIIYNHIVGDKPEFDKWLKETPFIDLEHYYMAAYKASFFGANYIPMNCTSDDCDHVFLTDDIDIESSMVKFKDDAAKDRFYKIMSGERVGDYSKPEFIMLTDNIAVTLREPSIYNTVFENTVLDQKFVQKYESMLGLMVYIDKIYLVRGKNASPVAVKEDPNSIAKNAKYRIATYAKIISKLPSDAYIRLSSRITEKNDQGSEVTYCYPETTCPKCGHKIEQGDAQAAQLLFSRHRLSLLMA